MWRRRRRHRGSIIGGWRGRLDHTRRSAIVGILRALGDVFHRLGNHVLLVALGLVANRVLVRLERVDDGIGVLCLLLLTASMVVKAAFRKLLEKFESIQCGRDYC